MAQKASDQPGPQLQKTTAEAINSHLYQAMSLPKPQIFTIIESISTTHIFTINRRAAMKASWLAI